jgi:ferredoxin-NADP reductase
LTIWFKPERKLRFTAGQFTELTLSHFSPDNRGIRRWFTLSSAPNEELVGITTRFASHDGSTFKHALKNLKPGDMVEIAEAMGDFVLPKLETLPLVFVAGGMGITPLHSIAAWIATTDETRSIHTFHAVRSEDDIIFADTFATANIPITRVVSEPSKSWGGLRGHISAQQIIESTQASDETMFYLSGPEAMVETLQSEFLNLGIRQHRIAVDYFPGYPEL